MNVLLWPFRMMRRAWRRITPEGAKKVALLSVSLFVLISTYSVALQREQSKFNRRILFKVEEQTSPEARARETETIDGIIVDIDCRTQATLQRVIDVLVDKEVLQPGDVAAITEDCILQLRDPN